MPTNIDQEANLLSRMERLPINKTLISIAALLTACWVMEAFDLGMIGPVLLVLKELWNLDASAVGLLGACSTVGVVIGTMTAGFLTDRYGRKKILLCGVFIFTAFTLIGSIYANYTWIVTMRFISGLGAGAVFPLPYLMISELAPAKHRGFIVCACNTVLTASYCLPVFCGSWAINAFSLDVAWRVPFIIGGLPVISVYFLYKYLPESPRWLMKRGRYAEVRSLVERMEKSSGVAHDDTYIDPTVQHNLEQTKEAEKRMGKHTWKTLFKKPYLSRSLVSWTMYTAAMITWYVVMVYVPTILHNYGFDMGNSVILTGAMMLIGGLGALAIGPLADKYGRKPIWSLYVIITIINLFLLASTESMPLLLLYGAFVAFFGTGIIPVCKVYVAEQYPTELRGVGTGFGEAYARIFGGVLATYYVAFFLSVGGTKAVFSFMAGAFALALLGLWIWGQETARRSVESTSSTNQAS